ncbi:hypothetical protein PInf_009296 [Phytophthora infestans]|nr:hypothetical protein PInf_009296 [Phytophthora infestans]
MLKVCWDGRQPNVIIEKMMQVERTPKTLRFGIQLLYTHFELLGFADAEPSDPNIVLGDVEKSNESDGEVEDPLGAADMLVTDDEAEALVDESVVAESSRIASLLDEVELEMAVEGSSEVFNDYQ